MGRLTLNILLSFAQFERELTVERVKDKIAAAKRKGKYLGGKPALGYDLDRDKKCLVINPDEAVKIKYIFNKYKSLKSTLKLSKDLNKKGFHTKIWKSKSGKINGGKPWNKSNVHRILINPLYKGFIKHHDKIFKGEHEPIIDEVLWEEVQDIMRENKVHLLKNRNKNKVLLKNILYCGHCETTMGLTFTSKRNRTYRYYLCTNANKTGYNSCPVSSIATGEIEQAVISQLRSVFTSYESIIEVLQTARECEIELLKSLPVNPIMPLKETDIKTNKTDIEYLLKSLEYKADIEVMDKIWDEIFPLFQEEIIHEILDKVIVFENRLELFLNINGLCSLIMELTKQNQNDNMENKVLVNYG